MPRVNAPNHSSLSSTRGFCEQAATTCESVAWWEVIVTGLEGANASELSKPAWIRDSCQFGNPQLTGKESRVPRSSGSMFVSKPLSLSLRLVRRSPSGVPTMASMRSGKTHISTSVTASLEIFSSCVGRYGGSLKKSAIMNIQVLQPREVTCHLSAEKQRSLRQKKRRLQALDRRRRWLASSEVCMCASQIRAPRDTSGCSQTCRTTIRSPAGLVTKSFMCR